MWPATLAKGEWEPMPEEGRFMLTLSSTRIPFNLWRADHWYNKPVKKATRPSKQDYTYYFKHNVSITTSGDFSTQGLKFCLDEIGVDRCLYSIGKWESELAAPSLFCHFELIWSCARLDYPYDSIKEAQDWWKGIDLPQDQKEAVARRNAIRLFKLPLEE